MPKVVGTSLAGLKKPADFVSENKTIFPSLWSWEWFKRRHRNELDAEGALVIVNGRMFIDPDPCERVILRTGVEAARADPRGRE